MARNTPGPSRAARIAALQKLIDGLNQYQATFTTMRVNGEQLATAEVVARLRKLVGINQATDTTHAAWQAAVKEEDEANASMASFVGGVRGAALIGFNGQVDALAAFGLTERKRREFTPVQVQEAAAKARATRAARHTMGPRQKARIKGAPVQEQPPPGETPDPQAKS